jgi:transposase
MTTHKSEDFKISAVEYYLTSDKNQLEVCEIFNCSARSLMRWVSKYENDGSVERYNRVPIAYKVSKEHVKFILSELKRNKTITIEDLLIKLQRQFLDLELSERHVARVLRDNNVTLKLTHLLHVPNKRFGKDVDIKDQLNRFYREISKYRLEDIICIDETSIKSLEKRHHCYNDLGKRCTIKTQSQEVFKKYTGIFAICSEGALGWKLYEKSGIDSTRLSEFLEEHITGKYKNKLIILDNASSHRNDKIKKLVNKDNKLLYTIPYQHFTNSIENWFSMMKARLRKLEGLKYTELKTNINKVLRSIPKEYYRNIMKGAYEREIKPVKESRARPLKNYL